ncbi:MAG: glycosyltransferase [Anaerolineaceae bacterium]|nr:MAG: glycosyltransferase [Anaerolineaceae bacterium]
MKILLLLQDDIMHQQRIAKEIYTLGKAGHEILLLEVLPPSSIEILPDGATQTRIITLWTRTLPKNVFFWAIKWFEMTIKMTFQGLTYKPDVVHCVNRITLLAGYIISKFWNIAFLYDSQEIESEVNSSANWPKWFWLGFERLLADRATRIMVTDHFRREITSEILKIEHSRFFVLMSLPMLRMQSICRRNLRAEFGGLDAKIVVYAGAINPGRHIEEIVESISLLPPDFVFAIVGFVTNDYRKSLELLINRLGIHQRVAFLPPVKWSDISDYISTADCALALYEMNSLNNCYCSPSKLFDAIMAGLPVIGTDTPLMREVLSTHDVGMCISHINASSIATAIRTIVERKDLLLLKSRLRELGREKYNWEAQEDSFLRFYENLLSI